MSTSIVIPPSTRRGSGRPGLFRAAAANASVAGVFAGLLIGITSTVAAQEKLGVPFALIENQGQWPGAAKFCGPRGSTATVWFEQDGFVFDLRSSSVATANLDTKTQAESPDLDAGLDRRSVMRLVFEGALPGARLQPSDRLSTYYNFFVSKDSKQWRSRVPAYGKLRYTSLHKGIDVVVREGSLFAYDLHVAAGVDPSAVVVRCDGVKGISITDNGELILETPHGVVRQAAPVAWQGAGADATTVSARFVKIDDKRYGFTVDGRDPELPLVIDPDVTWATYIGGSLIDPLTAVAKGSTKGPTAKVTAIGRANSLDFPTTVGSYQSTHAGGHDSVVMRFDPAALGKAQLVWSTYLGGKTANVGTRNDDSPLEVKVDVLGNVVLAGSTKCKDFPVTTGAYQTTFGGGEADGFFSKLNGSGTSLLYSTFYGGNSHDWICDFELSGVFVASMVGFTNSTDLPKVNAYQAAKAGAQDLFVAKLDPTRVGSAQITYASYLGGALTEGNPFTSGRSWQLKRDLAMDLDASGRILITSKTSSTNYPMKNPYQGTNPNTTGAYSSVVTILDPSKAGAAQLIYSTYLGSTGNDHGRCTAFASGGLVVAAGYTNSPGFPTTKGAFDTTLGGTSFDTFVTWLDPSKAGAAQLAYSTFLGGSSRTDYPFNLVIDTSGVANLNGTCGAGFPTTPGAFDRTHNTLDDGWFARLAPDGNGTADLVYSTLLGGGPSMGSIHTWIIGSVLDGEGGIFLCGKSKSVQFPTTKNAYKGSGSLSGPNDGLLMHLWGLNHGVAGVGASTPVTCAGALKMGARGFPTRGNANFKLTSWGTQPNAMGFIGLGLPPRVSVPVCSATLYVSPVLVIPVQASAAGELVVPAPIAATTPIGTSVLAQVVWGNSGCCLTMTNGLHVTILK